MSECSSPEYWMQLNHFTAVPVRVKSSHMTLWHRFRNITIRCGLEHMWRNLLKTYRKGVRQKRLRGQGRTQGVRPHTSRLHIVRQEYLHMRARTHTHIHATNHHQTLPAGQSARAGQPWPPSAMGNLLPVGRHAHAYLWGLRLEP